MLERREIVKANPSSVSLIALKPRQILLLEEQRKNSAKKNPVAMNRPENKVQLKPEQKTLLFYSFALCLKKYGFSKALKRLLSEAQIKDDDWEARALNLEDIFFKYLDTCDEVHTNIDLREDQECQVDGTAASEENVRKTKKRNNKDIDFAVTGSGKISEEVLTQHKVTESNANSKKDKNKITANTLVQSEHELLALKKVTDDAVREITVDGPTKKQKEKKKKKSKLTFELLDGNEKRPEVMPKVTEEKRKDLNESKDDYAALVESKEKKEEKKLKKDGLLEDGEEGSLKNRSKVDVDKVVSGILLEGDRVQDKKKKRKKEASVELSGSDAGVLDNKKEIINKSKKKSVETVEDGANEYKMASKKRKRLAHDEDGKQAVEEVAVEETKRRKTDGQEEAKDVELQGNGSLNNTGVEKSSEPKSTRKQSNNFAEPKTVNAFQRVKVDEVKFVDERLQDNSYWAKDGAETGYGAKAQGVLGQVRGRYVILCFMW
ncbi:Hypothetical predicted protein [Olea europaea subsp. europaea]|uniref:Srp40 C-terminal domain-containing protein n=1 Tax=Olea europaea subsp. europaea TaxID=158383 RepID=A0A8S0QL71_OLEEU|nr:Hypothetical predicted protein [Olea europaea subsp. europaea]